MVIEKTIFRSNFEAPLLSALFMFAFAELPSLPVELSCWGATKAVTLFLELFQPSGLQPVGKSEELNKAAWPSVDPKTWFGSWSALSTTIKLWANWFWEMFAQFGRVGRVPGKTSASFPYRGSTRVLRIFQVRRFRSLRNWPPWREWKQRIESKKWSSETKDGKRVSRVDERTHLRLSFTTLVPVQSGILITNHEDDLSLDVLSKVFLRWL